MDRIYGNRFGCTFFDNQWDQEWHDNRYMRGMAPPPMELAANPAAQSPDKVAPTADAPAKEVEKKDAAPAKAPSSSGIPEFNASDDEAFAKLSKLRQQMYALMKPLNGATVGTSAFDKVMTKDAWDKRKADEAASAALWAPYEAAKAKYEADMKLFKAGKLTEEPKMTAKRPEKDKLENLTTCIETQACILREGLKNAGFEMKLKEGSTEAQYYLGSKGQKEATALGAWTTAARSNDRGEGPRPKLGDILVFSKRGEDVDKVASEIATTPTNKFHGKAKPVLDLEKQIADFKKLGEGMDEAAKTANETKIAGLEGKLTKAKAELEKYLDGLRAKLDKMREGVAEKATKDQLAFSHVDIVVRIEKDYKDPKEPGVYKEKWLTMDGGQTINQKQGSRLTERVYTPSRNEISGEASQGGADRWVQGWIDVDKLVKPQPETVST